MILRYIIINYNISFIIIYTILFILMCITTKETFFVFEFFLNKSLTFFKNRYN